MVAATNGAQIWLIGMGLGLLALAAIFVALMQGTSSTGKCLLTVGAFLCGSIALKPWRSDPGEALNSGWWQPLVLPLLALPLVISAFAWIDAPTKEGRAVLDHIAVQEYRRSPSANASIGCTHPKTLLSCSSAIFLRGRSRRRESVGGSLRKRPAAAAVQGRQGFAWYSGSSDPWNNPGSFVNTMGSSLREYGQLCVDLQGSSSGSGRRRIIRWWWRRRRRRRLVATRLAASGRPLDPCDKASR